MTWKTVLQCVVIGLAGGAVTQLIYRAATGEDASLLLMLVGTELMTSVWGLVQAVRFRKKWAGVIAAYRMPALGEGIDTPNRPPAENE